MVPVFVYCFSTLPIFKICPLGTSITASNSLVFFQSGTSAASIFAFILLPAGLVVTNEPFAFASPP